MEHAPKIAEINIAPREMSEFLAVTEKTSVDVTERLNASNDTAAKAEFLAHPEMTRPRNEYGNLDYAQADENVRTISEALAELPESGLAEKEQRLVVMSLEDNLKKNKFLVANHVYLTAQGPAEKELAEMMHHETNEALYGKCDEKTFWAILEEKVGRIPERESLDENDQKQYDELMEMLPEIKHFEAGRFIPKEETVMRFSEMVQEFYGGILSHVPEEKESFTIQEATDIANEILTEEIGGTEWKAVLVPDATNASVVPSERIMKFPGKRTQGDYSPMDLKKILVHELGTHVMRSLAYDDAPKGFRTGMPDYETFDEGVAKALEAGVAGKFEEAGLVHYVSIGLATYTDKNFREIFEIQKRLEHLTGGWSETRCLNSVQRAHRGTGELPNNKDLAYYNGSNFAWKYIEEHLDDPELFDNLFLTGKTDLLNQDEQRLVYEAKVGGF